MSPRGAGLSHNKRGFLLSLLSYVGTLGVGMANGMLTARVLGVEGRGELAAIQNPVLQLAPVLLFGIPSALTFYTVRASGAARSLFATAFAFTTLLCLPVVAGAWFALPLIMKGSASWG